MKIKGINKWFIVYNTKLRLNISRFTIRENKKLLKRSGSKQGKEYMKAVFCHPDYLPSMQNTS